MAIGFMHTDTCERVTVVDVLLYLTPTSGLERGQSWRRAWCRCVASTCIVCWPRRWSNGRTCRGQIHNRQVLDEESWGTRIKTLHTLMQEMTPPPSRLVRFGTGFYTNGCQKSMSAYCARDSTEKQQPCIHKSWFLDINIQI